MNLSVEVILSCNPVEPPPTVHIIDSAIAALARRRLLLLTQFSKAQPLPTNIKHHKLHLQERLSQKGDTHITCHQATQTHYFQSNQHVCFIHVIARLRTIMRFIKDNLLHQLPAVCRSARNNSRGGISKSENNIGGI